MAVLRLQDRDLDMLHSLSIGRLLTVTALEWLHFPAWRERWHAYQSAVSAPAGYYPQSRVYLRLSGLEVGGLVACFQRMVERASLRFKRQPDVYGITRAGAELLVQRRALDEVDYLDARQRAVQNLEHSVAIGTLYAALRAEIEHAFAGREQQLVLSGWQGDHLLARDYDKIAIPGRRNRRMVDGQWGVVPDATFQLTLGDRTRRYFVELDRGTRALSTWLDKAYTYEHYRGSAAIQRRFGVNDFVLLIVGPTARRLEQIAEQVVRVQRQPGRTYLFIEADQVHPTAIRTGFRAVGEAQIARQVVGGRLVDVPQVQFVEQPLWSIPAPAVAESR